MTIVDRPAEIVVLPNGIVVVTLERRALDLATEIARGRERSAIEHKRKEVYGAISDPSERAAISNVAAELAVSLWTGLPWTGQAVLEDPYGNRKKPDVGDDVQVYRCGGGRRGGLGLIVHPPDPDDQRWICAAGEAPAIHLWGWRYAGEVKTLVRRGSDPRKVAYLLPPHWLRPLSTWGEP